jgi:hypothetical protein
MTYLNDLPKDVVDVIRTTIVSEYATVSAAGVPIDTPIFVFPSADLATLDVATGLAYPVKAERARRNPKVGLLLEGKKGQPVVSVAGNAAVRDANLQANLDRYLAETIFTPVINPTKNDWEVTRQAIWYLTRVIVSITPVHIRWWKNHDAMDAQPEEWRAPAGTDFPKSDPAPTGKSSDAPKWPQKNWREYADIALKRGSRGHLTLLDSEGYPLSIGAKEIALSDDGFRLVMPKGSPWTEGKATLSFLGQEIFVGDASLDGDTTALRVERALPVLPMVEDTSKVLRPTPELRATLMGRLTHEAERRGQGLPKTPAQPPEPSEGHKIRIAALG